MFPLIFKSNGNMLKFNDSSAASANFLCLQIFEQTKIGEDMIFLQSSPKWWCIYVPLAVKLLRQWPWPWPWSWWPWVDAWDGRQLPQCKKMIPRGGTTTKGRVKSQKSDAVSNPIWLANANPILTHTYEVDDGNETKLNANLIAEAMYVQCDPDENQYVLLDSTVDHWCLDTAIWLSGCPTWWTYLYET